MKSMDSKTKVKFNKLVVSCQSFYRASLILWEDYRLEDSIEKVTPIIVNTSFTCELALKAILLRCGQGYHTGHKLYNLFEALTPEVKEFIKEALKLLYPQKTEDWIVNRIKLVSANYQKARYFQDYTIAIDLTFSKNFMEALVYIEQRLCGVYIAKDASDEIKVDEKILDEEIDKTMSAMISEAEKSLKNTAVEVNNKAKK